jgi:DNA-binding Lrp family transcriptional regulator
MQDAVDELDLALVNALQVRPRASWAVVGRAVGMDPVTAARRWQRMSEAGLAWVTCEVAGEFGRRVAFLEVDVDSRMLDEVVDRLARDPRIASIHHMAAERPLLLGVVGSGPAALSRFIIDSLGAVPGVRVERVHSVTQAYLVGSSWRLQSLEPAQSAALVETTAGVRSTVAMRELTTADRQLLHALSMDGRLSYAALAAQTGLSETTARRRVDHLLAAGQAVLRCDLAQVASGWPQTAMLWIAAPSTRLEPIAHALGAVPEIRAILSVAGPANLLLFAWLRDVIDLPRLEERLCQRFPEITVVNRAVCLHTMKLAGRRLDGNARSIDHIPVSDGATLVE